MEWSFQPGDHRRGRGRALTATALLSLAGLGLTGCTPVDGTDAATSLPAQASTVTGPTSVPHSAVPPATATGGNLLPVYWMGDNNGSILLYREFLKGEQGGDPIAAAVQAMTTSAPLDPDYFGPWSPAGTVSASISPGNIITVDMSRDAFGTRIDEGSAYRAVQQLVYTATAAAASSGLVSGGDPSSVVILVDGETGFNAFGHIELGGQMQRDTALMAPIWVIEPQHGEVRDQPEITVSGSGVSDDAVLYWRIDEVVGADLKPHRSGTVGLDERPGSPGLFEFTVALEPGEYEVTVFDRPAADQDNPDQDNKELNADTKRFDLD
ncbi:GerMN domain-containing protein [Arthrobacter sp. 260]|uniref:GerMN domain-containing protein n=1 Tax=Arthrobacter sp. 260 TaxID=2735314 RepID=UPI0014918458|nr:GerMN domain-containing protein [Arthrobacter sp. 260]NOJ61729.1 GerMN domain-containing protein [Arthrobacter sp. 260]